MIFSNENCLKSLANLHETMNMINDELLVINEDIEKSINNFQEKFPYLEKTVIDEILDSIFYLNEKIDSVNYLQTQLRNNIYEKYKIDENNTENNPQLENKSKESILIKVSNELSNLSLGDFHLLNVLEKRMVYLIEEFEINSFK